MTDSATQANVQKVFKIDNALIGVAGCYASAMEFLDWLTQADIDSDKPDNMQDVTALVLRGGQIWCYEGNLTPYRIYDDFAAIGSGSQAALAAMHMGATTAQAVEIAGRIDPYTGGKVDTAKC